MRTKVSPAFTIRIAGRTAAENVKTFTAAHIRDAITIRDAWTAQGYNADVVTTTP